MEKEISDRQRRLQRRFSLIMYLLIFAALCYPWIMVGEKRYNLISFAMCLKTEGAESIVARAGLMPDPSYSSGLWVSVWIYLAFAVVCGLYLVIMFWGKDWHVNVAALLMSILFTYVNMWEYMIGTVCTNSIEAILYPGVLMLLTGVECIGRKMIEI